MAIAILKSFDRGRGLAILQFDGSPSELAAHVTGSDRAVMSSVVPGQRIGSTSDAIEVEELSQ